MPPSGSDTFKLLLSTDNHLGYAEKDPVRGKDSFRTFQEILRLAQRENVDLLLLAGDLFHDNKPSRATMYQTMSLLRTHTMGDGPVAFQVVSDQSLNFPNFGLVNFEDPNYNIQLPVFSIHGNHDDPARDGSTHQSLAALDLLSAANFINYFGKCDKVDAIEVFPVLLVKGATRVAIYGLGNMRDERLNRMFAQQKVVFRRPAEDPEQWFSIFVVHQNRDDRGRGSKNCVHESFIPDFIDFVVWGHEHECLINAQESVKGDFFITQPGSSVATSLVEGEARPKHVAVMEINGQSFRMSNRVLKTVRPFKIEEIVLSEVEDLDPNDPDITERIHAVLDERVREMLGEAEIERRQQEEPAHPELNEILVRLRVEHTGFPILHNQRFGSKYVGKVANPNDILLFYRHQKERASMKDKKSKLGGILDEPIRPTRLDTVTIEDLLSSNLHQPDQKMVFLPEAPMAIALEDYIVKNIPSALDEFVDQILEETQRELVSKTETKSKQDIMNAVEKKQERAQAEELLQMQEKQDRDSQFGSFNSSYLEYGNSKSPSVGNTNEEGKNHTSRFGTPRSTTSQANRQAPELRAKANDTEASILDDDEDDAAFLDSRKKAVRKRKAPSPVTVKPKRTASTRAAASTRTKRASKPEWLSEEEDPDVVDDDGDEDFDMSEQEEESELSVKPQRKRATSAAKTAPKGRKRLRKESEIEESDEDMMFIEKPKQAAPKPKANTTKRATRAPSKPSQDIDLVSSDSDHTGRAFSARASAATSKKKPTPQRRIDDMFHRQAKTSTADDEVESDAEFTQLARATKSTGSTSSRFQLQVSQPDTQTEPSQVLGSIGDAPKRRKLPLSMVASSQQSSQSLAPKETAPARTGWGRSRR